MPSNHMIKEEIERENEREKSQHVILKNELPDNPSDLNQWFTELLEWNPGSTRLRLISGLIFDWANPIFNPNGSKLANRWTRLWASPKLTMSNWEYHFIYMLFDMSKNCKVNAILIMPRDIYFQVKKENCPKTNALISGVW